MPCRFIFPITLLELDKRDVLIEHWRMSSRAIQQMPGARGTRLHQKTGSDTEYRAIAEWESEAARAAAFAELRKPEHPLGQIMRQWNQDEVVAKWGDPEVLEEIAVELPPHLQTQ